MDARAHTHTHACAHNTQRARTKHNTHLSLFGWLGGCVHARVQERERESIVKMVSTVVFLLLGVSYQNNGQY